MSQIVFTGDRYYETGRDPRTGPPVVRRQPDPRGVVGHLAQRGLRPATAEALWIENTLGGEDYRDYMRTRSGPSAIPDLFVNDGILIDPDPILPNAMIYDKGAWVLHMLRMWIGPDAFREFLFAYATGPGTGQGHRHPGRHDPARGGRGGPGPERIF